MKAIQKRCHEALRQLDGIEHDQYVPPLREELELIETRNLSAPLLTAAEFYDQYTNQQRTCYALGSAGCSLVNFLLEFTKYDPIPHQLDARTFWICANNEPPEYIFVLSDAWPDDDSDPYLVLHPMSSTEKVAWTQFFGNPNQNDEHAWRVLAQGDCEGIHELDSPNAQQLCQDIQPTTLRELATIIALERMSYSRQARFRKLTDERSDLFEHPLIFQEQILAELQSRGGLNYQQADQYRRSLFRNERDEGLHNRLLQNLQCHHREDFDSEEWLDEIAEASRTLTSLAGHLSSAVTAYRAAWIKSRFRNSFYKLLADLQNRGN